MTAYQKRESDRMCDGCSETPRDVVVIATGVPPFETNDEVQLCENCLTAGLATIHTPDLKLKPMPAKGGTALVYLSVAVELDRFPVPEDEYHHVLAGVIATCADMLADGCAAEVIDRIELVEEHDG